MQEKNPQPDMEFYSVYDSKGKCYNEPFPSKNVLTAIREFEVAFKNPEAPFKNRYYQAAEDFALFKIASFTSATGEFRGINPEHVMNFHDLRASCQAQLKAELAQKQPGGH